MNFSTSGMHQEKLSATSMMVQDYLLSRSEDSLLKLQRHLTLLEQSNDASLHDTSTMKGVEFFNNLHALLVAVKSTNPLVWSVTSILQKVCTKSDRGHCSTLSEMFVPVLGRLLNGSLTLDKKLKLLDALQVLTWGIKIEWQAPYLEPMIQNVSSSVRSVDPKEASLSMSILVNLLHRNPPARHTFLRCVKAKDFMKQLLKDTKTLEFRVEVSKFMMLMADLSDYYPNQREVKKFVQMTFQTVYESIRKENVSLIRHSVNFFEDVIQIEKVKPIIFEYPSFVTEIESILKILEGDSPVRGCESMLLTLLGHLLSLQLPEIVMLLDRIIVVSSKMVSSRDQATRSSALSLLLGVADKSVLQSTPEWQAVNIALQGVLPVLAALLVQPIPRKEANSLLELLCKLTKVQAIKKEMFTLLDIKILQSFFESLFVDWHPAKKALPVEDAVFFSHLLVLISEFVQQDSAYLQLFSQLSEQTCVLFAAATALKFGPPAVSYKILKFSSVLGFSDGSARALAECLSQVTGTVVTEKNTQQLSQAFPESPVLFGAEERSRLESLLSQLESSGDVPVSALMTVVQYRTNMDAREVSLLNSSLETANSRIALLRQQVDASKNEVQHLQFGLLDVQSQLEQCKVERDGAFAAEAAAEANASRAFKESEEKVRLLQENNAKTEKTVMAQKKTIEDQSMEIQKLTSSVQTLSRDFHSLQERHNADLRLLLEKEEEIKEKSTQIKQLELIKNAINDITSGKKKLDN